MDMSGNESDETSDEVSEIKSAMRICRTRQRAFQEAVSGGNSISGKDVGNFNPNVNENSASSTALKKQHCEEIIKLEKRCMALEDELNYTKKVLKTKEKNLREESNLIDLKIQAIDAEYKQSFDEMKKKLTKNNKEIKIEVSKLFYILNMIERNTMHGRHITNSETNVGLMLKLRSGLEDISNIVGSSSSSSSTNTDNEVGTSVDDRSSPGREQEQAPLVDTTLLEICRQLEEENKELKSRVEADQLKLNKYQSRATKITLIPHYRAAIVKTREECKQLQADLEESKEQNIILRSQLETRSVDIQKLEANRTKLEALLFQLKDERDKYKAVILDVIDDKLAPSGRKNTGSLHREKNHINATATKYSSVSQPASSRELDARTQQLMSSALSIDEIRNLKGRESLMQSNLSVLDTEIEKLRQRLESAAIARTQSIVADVINCANKQAPS